jgi:hypothetical protein
VINLRSFIWPKEAAGMQNHLSCVFSVFFFYTQNVLLNSFFSFLLVFYLFIYVSTSLFYVLRERVRLEEEDEAALPMMGSH